MSAAKHTPGPLRVMRSKKNGDFAVATAEGDIVAECYEAIRRHDERATDEAKAHATLFAAAPELLVALQNLEAQGWLRHLLDEAATVDPHDVSASIRATVAQCRAAIAKATGSAS